MANIADEHLNEMLKQMPKKERAKYSAIITGKSDSQVRCMSDTCKGRVIATIDSNQRVTETEPVPLTDKEREKGSGSYGMYSSGLEGSRPRLDGEMGFRCYCGNDSRIAEHEQGHVGITAPSAKSMEKVYDNLSKNPTKYVRKGKSKTVDGFSIEKV